MGSSIAVDFSNCFMGFMDFPALAPFIDFLFFFLRWLAQVARGDGRGG